MPVITLTSDWNDKGYYAASVKGAILSGCPAAKIVDISHRVPPFNIAQAAFIIRNCYRQFPSGTIHIIAIAAEPSDEQPIVALKAGEHYFIGVDNGIFSLVLDEVPEQVVAISPEQDAVISNFPELDIFVPAACKLAGNKKITTLGPAREGVYKQMPLSPAFEESVINGNVIFIDSYRNAITNISQNLFNRIGKERPFEIFIQSNYYKINKINKKYRDTSEGEILAIFNSAGLLEIAMNNGPVSELLNLDIKSNIRVKFYDNKNS